MRKTLKKLKKRLILNSRLVFNKPSYLPNFIIAGVQKGGTTSLYEYLIQHPKIDAALKKEIHYFDLGYNHGEKWYKAHFTKKNTSNLTGESSPYYFFHPEVPQRVAQLIPNVKIIILLREPIDRAYSHYQYMLKKGIEKERDFNIVVQRELDYINKGQKISKTKKSYQHQHYSYLSRGKYDEQLERWFKYFKKDQFLILKSEDLFSNPTKVLKQVYDFLNVKHFIPKDLSIKNKGKKLSNKLNTTIDLEAFFKIHNANLEKLINKKMDWNQ